jgi:spoIIIJ-associated protein
MEWIEVQAKSLDEAVELALDRLGVVADELEYEVIDEPRTGLFGRLGRGNARIRARVKPLSREKPADKRRRRRGSEHRSGNGGRSHETTKTPVGGGSRDSSA